MQEHLAWLDREIATAAGQDAPLPSKPAPTGAAQPLPVTVPRVVTAPAPVAMPAPIPLATDATPAVADEIIEQYRVAPDAMKTDVRKGCFLYFFAALALFALGVAVLYFAFRHGK